MITSSLKKKIENHLISRTGVGSILTVLGAAVAAAIIVFPLARWQMSLSNNTANVADSLDNAGTKLEMMSALEDRWRQINDMNIDEFKAAGNKTTTYGKYTVSESFGTLGKYNSSTGKCDAGTPGDDDRACRTATLTVTGPEGVLPLGPVTATRVASAGKLKFSHATNGYEILPTGLILQWGEIEPYYVPGTNDYDIHPVSFPIPFPNKCVAVMSKHYQNLSGYFSFIPKQVTRTGFNLMADTTGQNSPGNSLGAWIAIGY